MGILEMSPVVLVSKMYPVSVEGGFRSATLAVNEYGALSVFAETASDVGLLSGIPLPSNTCAMPAVPAFASHPQPFAYH